MFINRMFILGVLMVSVVTVNTSANMSQALQEAVRIGGSISATERRLHDSGAVDLSSGLPLRAESVPSGEPEQVQGSFWGGADVM